MNLRNLSDDQLHASNIEVADNEREATVNLLKHLSETERRHLFSRFSCDSLHAYCVRHLKMSDAHAGRRISASRLLNELPIIEEKVLSGAMTLSSVCQANTFFRKEAASGNRFKTAEKLEVLKELEGQSTREVDKILLSQSDQPEIHIRETVRQKTRTLTELKLLIDEETLENLNRLKEILSHEMPNATFADIIARISKLGLEKLDPARKAERAQDRHTKNQIVQTDEARDTKRVDEDRAPITCFNSAPAPEPKRSRYIPSAVRHAVWMRDGGRCTFVDETTGECCKSRRFIEFDHIVAFANGGSHAPENLRLRCRAHNQRHEINIFGFNRFNSLGFRNAEVRIERS